MNAKVAYKILRTIHPEKKAVSCHEYDSVFVFALVPNDFDETKSTEGLLDILKSVDKKNGRVGSFKPFLIPRDEYLNGKEVKNFN